MNQIIQPRNLRPFNIGTYVPLLITTFIGLIVLPGASMKFLVAGLCVLFGAVYAIRFHKINTHPLLAFYFAVQVALVLALTIIARPSDAFTLLLFVLSIQITMLLPIRAALPFLILFYVINSQNAFLNFDANGMIELIFNAATIFFTAVLGYSLRQTEIAYAEKELVLKELQATQQQLQEMAVTGERTRLSRELHDSLGHQLTVAVVHLEGAQRLIPTKPEQASQMIGAMREELKNALADLRRTVTALRSPMINDLPIEAALLNLSQAFQQNTGLIVHFNAAERVLPLPEEYKLALYRAAQEALTNIQRHANAQNAWIDLAADEDQIRLRVKDDGKGLDEFSETSPGLGLIGLGERASQLGGEMRISTQLQAGGAQLIFTLPMPKDREIK